MVSAADGCIGIYQKLSTKPSILNALFDPDWSRNGQAAAGYYMLMGHIIACDPLAIASVPLIIMAEL